MGPGDTSILCQDRGTMLGSCLGHIRAMFWLFLPYLCFQMPKMAQIFTKESFIPIRRILFNVALLRLYQDNVWAMSGPCLAISTISLLPDD